MIAYFQADGVTYLFSNGKRVLWIPAELFEDFVEALLKRNLFVRCQWMVS